MQDIVESEIRNEKKNARSTDDVDFDGNFHGMLNVI